MFDLLRRDCDALEINFGAGRELAQRLFDVLAGIDAAWIEIAEAIDVSRNVEIVDVFGRAVQERRALAALYRTSLMSRRHRRPPPRMRSRMTTNSRSMMPSIASTAR